MMSSSNNNNADARSQEQQQGEVMAKGNSKAESSSPKESHSSIEKCLVDSEVVEVLVSPPPRRRPDAAVQAAAASSEQQEGGASRGGEPAPPTMPPSGQQEGVVVVQHHRAEQRHQHQPAILEKERYINGRVRTVGTDPDFLESFFTASRLSFIGSYKQRAKESPTKKIVHSNNNSRRFVFHVDMDCFFASVVLRNYPEYQDKPVAISHHGKKAPSPGDDGQFGTTTSNNNSNKDSTSECATCNYRAREFGVKKGMYLGRAKELCPSLVVLQYDFEGYEEVSEQVTEIISGYADTYAGNLEQVSCDEAYLELWIDVDDGADGKDDARTKAFEIAESIRTKIFEATQCTATVGVASNKFLAKLAGDHVKPNKSFVVDQYRSLLRDLKLRDLHGIGYRLDKKLENEGLVYVRDVWDLGKEAETELSRILGPGIGRKIHQFCSGVDNRKVEPAERKTIGAECNYGVRFNGPYGVDHMVAELAKEVEKRMTHVGVRGSKITLKLKQRKPGAPPPPKFLGHGSCFSLSKSCDTPNGEATRDQSVISKCGMEMFSKLAVKTDDIRGMGIVVSKLTTDGGKPSGRGAGGSSIMDLFKNAQALKPDGVGDTKPTSAAGYENDVGDANPTSVRNDDDSAATNNEIDTPESPEEDDNVPRSTTSSPFELVVMEEPGDQDEEDDDEVVVAGVTASQEDFDIEIPSMSQIHLSQVEELPSPMRRQILSKMEDQQADDDDEEQQHSQDPIRPSNSRRSFRQSSVRAAASSSTSHPTKGEARFRQTDMRHLMKLAAVKSRQQTIPSGFGDDEAVSLSQLNSLPLGMQLLVTNEDYKPPVASTTSIRRRQKAKTSAKVCRHRAALPQKRKASVARKDAPSSRGTFKPAQSAEGRHLVHDEGSSDGDLIADSSPEDFFVENVKPLSIFLDENSPSNQEAVASVVQFFALCMTESRFSDAAILLRSIANRNDDWSAHHERNNDSNTADGAVGAFETIFEAVNAKTEELLGDGLDWDWIVSRQQE